MTFLIRWGDETPASSTAILAGILGSVASLTIIVVIGVLVYKRRQGEGPILQSYIITLISTFTALQSQQPLYGDLFRYCYAI